MFVNVHFVLIFFRLVVIVYKNNIAKQINIHKQRGS